MALDTILTTAAAARLAGVGDTTIKRWADQGLLAFTRTAGGHRRFRAADVASCARRQSDGEGRTRSSLELLLKADPDAAEEALLASRAQYGNWFRAGDMLAELLVRVGTCREEGLISVDNENLVAHQLSVTLARIAASLPRRADAPCAVLACAEGESHTLGLSLVELSLRELGWNTLWLGAGATTDQILCELKLPSVRLVALSASVVTRDELRLRQQAEQIASAAHGRDIRIVLGGAGAWPSHLAGTHRMHSLVELHNVFTQRAA